MWVQLKSLTQMILLWDSQWVCSHTCMQSSTLVCKIRWFRSTSWRWLLEEAWIITQASGLHYFDSQLQHTKLGRGHVRCHTVPTDKCLCFCPHTLVLRGLDFRDQSLASHSSSPWVFVCFSFNWESYFYSFSVVVLWYGGKGARKKRKY